jgi:hypothetical protein
VLLLSACSQAPPGPPVSQAADLETAAIERGLVRDPASVSLDGLYARDTDRLCIVGERIGVSVDYRDGVHCSGAGRVERSDERLRVDLGRGCSFEAHYDVDRIVFPAVTPEQCRRMCNGRASFAALEVSRLSSSIAEAATMRDARGRLPCRTG